LENWFSTADLFDRFLSDRDGIDVLAPGFSSFGGRRQYSGQIATAACAGDARLGLREVLAEAGQDRVLVADVGAYPGWALLGDQLAALGIKNGWAGVVLNGYVRDSACLATLDIGVHALGTVPSRPAQFGPARRNLPLHFGGATFLPGSWLYADQDGIVVCREQQFPLAVSGASCTA
jgi:regulator of ribonuclease activity A